LSGAVAKPASINLRKWFLSPTGLIKPWFHTEGNLPLCSSYLPLGVPNWVASNANQVLWELGRQRTRIDISLWVLCCLTPTILPTTQQILPKNSGSALGWTRSCSWGLCLAWESMMTISCARKTTQDYGGSPL
jgi:hypothetical protein